MSYKAVVAPIHTRELPGSDNIMLGSCLGYTIIVSKETQDGQLGVFFESDGKLSPEFAQTNDLVRRMDENGNRLNNGYFEENLRVRAVKMRGAKSEGFWCPLTHFAYTGYDLNKLKTGDQFDELNGHKICEKYFTPATLRMQKRRDKTIQATNKMFAKHLETEMFKRSAFTIPTGSIIHISEKQHGTSGRRSHVIVETPIVRKGLSKIFAKWFKKPTTKKEWKHLDGTRNCIIQERDGGGFHGPELFRYNVVNNLFLKKGEVIYFEICGYDERNNLIMQEQDTTKLKDKKIEKQFGSKMQYTYGQPVGTCDLYVYRITHVNEDGQAVDLSWNQVVQRCKELGLKTVHHIESFIYDGNLEELTKRVSKLVDGETGFEAIPSRLDGSHISEGVVLRIESEYGISFQKSKSLCFGLLEGYLKESNDFVDTEEIA